MLPTTIKSGDRTLRQIQRDGDKVLYEIYSRNPHQSIDKLVGWEVHLLKHVKGAFIKESFIPPHEANPSADEWGKYGFSYQTLEEAAQRYSRMPRKR